MDEVFKCEKCGACCKAVGCKLLTRNNTCSIYETRPDICNVRKRYSRVKHKMSLYNWYKLNKSCCFKLREYITSAKKGFLRWNQ